MRHWTQQEREHQAALIQNWRPWEQSTGPKTPEGKMRASRNADKPESITRRLRYLKQEVNRLVRQSKEIAELVG